MTFIELRDAFVQVLAGYLGKPVVLSDQTVPEAEYPYVYYQPVQPYIPRGGANMIRKTTIDTDGLAHDILTQREEYADGTFSFVACSRNRDAPESGYIFGDDEALELAEKTQGFFLHAGRHILQDLGIIVAEVMSVSPRSLLEVDEIDRRYGFDVRMRYMRVDTRKD